MRKKVSGDVTVVAVSGTHVVFFGFDMPKATTKSLMGFAIHRRDETEQEEYWLRSIKTFPDVEISVNEDANSHEHPFQAFQWADYTAKPDHEYVYRVTPMTGVPGNLKEKATTVVRIRTESDSPTADSKHGVYFNRGAIASQAYVKRFGLVAPEKAGPSAFEWLGRNLPTAMLAFIERAKAGWSLHCALYEIRYAPILEALKAAKARRVGVHVLYGATPGSETTTGNEEMLTEIGSPSYFKPRTNASIAHNKFIVLSQGEHPKAVWTGSSNLSVNAMFGQLNVGHSVESVPVAKSYKKYWDALAEDPETSDFRVETAAIAPLDENSVEPVQVIYSPYTGLSVFKYYASLAAAAEQALFMTFPFGMVKEFRGAYDHKDGVLRYALLDKYANGGNAASQKLATDETIRIRKYPNVGMALGERVYTDAVDGWRKEHSPLGVHVHWVHTKFMVVDPLGPTPTVITGSANWSEGSTNSNDENMLVIRGDKRVADIYFTEFMRIFAHHRFREALARHLKDHGNADDWKPGSLKVDPSEWVPAHYEAGNEYEIRRRYFSATV